MKHNVIRSSMIVLLIGLVSLAASRANAQRRHTETVEVDSFSWGLSSGQLARISVANFVFGDGSVRGTDPATACIQLLDTEGEVIAQSNAIRVEPGKIRFWDVSREQIRAGGDPRTGRLQVRARILVTTKPSDINRNRPPLAPTLEIIDPETGKSALTSVEWVFVGEVRDPPPGGV